MIFSASSQCRRCLNFLEGKTCKAFAQIPDEIWNGDTLHDKPYPNDNGILFDPKTISEMPFMEDED
jgi:hypothetical protein